MYLELTDIKDINLAQGHLSKRLKKEYPYKKRRVIGYPSGYFETDVWFSKTKGTEVSWWHSSVIKDGKTTLNLFGYGDPEANNSLFIDLQFNLPHKSFSRSHGGVFARELSTGQIVLGHRGIVTRGKARVKRELLLQEANVSLSQIASEVKPRSTEVLLVAPIEEPGLCGSIREFSSEIRRAASVVVGLQENANKGATQNSSKQSSSDLDNALNEYFDEFIGKTVMRRGGKVTMDCRHGIVVKAVRNKLEGFGKLYKSQKIDLAVETKDKIFLFEMKTNVTPQSLYTGIGQLYVHGATLSRKYPGKEIVRNLVVPSAPSSSDRKKLCKELGVGLINFTFKGREVEFSNWLEY